MKVLAACDLRVTQYARAHGLNVDTLIGCFERHCPDRWEAYVQKTSPLQKRVCPNCERSFVPMSGKQKFCTRKCGSDHNRNQAYFGGKRNQTVGLLDGICQLCGRENIKGLSSHHVIGKENDPENEVLIALCPGCHKIITLLATRNGVPDPAFWESLISLCWLRKHGAELGKLVRDGDALYVTVEIEVAEDYDHDEDDSQGGGAA